MANCIFPPRPKGKLNPTDLGKYEKTGQWLAQRKYNDTRSLLHIEPGFKMTAWSRHGEPHKRFILTKSLQKEIIDHLALDESLEYWLDGGIMNKHKDANGEMVFFDILQAGKYFFLNPSQTLRLELLAKICGNPTEIVPTKKNTPLALKISENLWLAPSFETGFRELFEESVGDDRFEGLVLRKKDSVLDNYGRVYYEVKWQIRCRKPNKMYNM